LVLREKGERAAARVGEGNPTKRPPKTRPCIQRHYKTPKHRNKTKKQPPQKNENNPRHLQKGKGAEIIPLKRKKVSPHTKTQPPPPKKPHPIPPDKEKPKPPPPPKQKQKNNFPPSLLQWGGKKRHWGEGGVFLKKKKKTIETGQNEGKNFFWGGGGFRQEKNLHRRHLTNHKKTENP